MEKFNPEKLKYLNAANRILKIFFREKKAGSPLKLAGAKQILIIDPTLIGDIVMLIPFLRTIKKTASDAKVTLVCGLWGKALLKSQKIVDDFIIIDAKVLNSPAEMIKKWGYVRRVLKQVNGKEYDIAIEPRGDLRYLFFMHFCRAARKVAYNYTGGECLLTDVIRPSEKATHLVEDKMYLAKKMGCSFTRQEMYPRLFLTQEQKIENMKFLQRHGLEEKRIIGIHPGASLAHKRWKDFGVLIQKLDIENAAYLIFSGPGEEAIAMETAECGRKQGRICLHIHETLEVYIRLIALCDACVCNDSGAGHLAAAYGVPAVVICGPFEGRFCKPYTDHGVAAVSHKLPCKPCMSDVCLTGTNECLRSITAEEVKQELYRLLEREKRWSQRSERTVQCQDG